MDHKVVLRDAYKGYTHDQDKIFAPEETVRKFKEKLIKIAAQKIKIAQDTINNTTHIVEGLKAANQKLADELETLKNTTDGGVSEATITHDVKNTPKAVIVNRVKKVKIRKFKDLFI